MAVDPTQRDLLGLHRALLRGDNAARVRLAELLLPALQRRFAGRRELDRDDISSLIGLTVARYLAASDDYDPAKAPLLAYLYRDACGDIQNDAAKRRRHAEVLLPEEGFELLSAPGNHPVEDQVMELLDPLDVPRSTVEAALAAFRDLSREEREFLQLRAGGIRSTHVYAEVLGIAHLPAAEQRVEVKRAKDRLDKRLGGIRDRLSR
jgi:hypothetical protein